MGEDYESPFSLKKWEEEVLHIKSKNRICLCCRVELTNMNTSPDGNLCWGCYNQGVRSAKGTDEAGYPKKWRNVITEEAEKNLEREEEEGDKQREAEEAFFAKKRRKKRF
jgi:hypothetical protein